jgi:HEAT repeat protein
MTDAITSRAVGSRIRRGRVAVLVPLVAAVCGCATVPPWLHGRKPSAEREKYGATADQRMHDLSDQAKAAKGGSSTQQTEFTRDLARKVLDEHDPRVRCAIVKAVADFDTPAALSICRGALEDPDERVRVAACSAWRQRGGPEAVELLAARYNADREIDVRLRALRELGQLGDKDAIPVLSRALEDPDPAVQYRAVAALRQISGRDLGDDVNAWRAWAADPEGGPEWSIAEGVRSLF